MGIGIESAEFQALPRFSNGKAIARLIINGKLSDFDFNSRGPLMDDEPPSPTSCLKRVRQKGSVKLLLGGEV